MPFHKLVLETVKQLVRGLHDRIDSGEPPEKPCTVECLVQEATDDLKIRRKELCC